jgi:diguanylate cyclase (GGDEF)-like protein
MDTFYIALYDESNGSILVPIYYDEGQYRNVGPFAIKENPGLTGYVIQRKKTLYLPDTLNITTPLPYPIIRTGNRPSRAYVGVPLMVREQVVGVLSIQNYEPGVYDDEHIKLLETIAAQAAIAVENARLFERTQSLAIVDALTGVNNRGHFYTQAILEIERAMRYGEPLSVIMLDLDHFKMVNDTYGHKSGDLVLQLVAKIFQQSLRKVDIIGRYGGEEFVFLLPETSLEEAGVVAERLRTLIAEYEVPVQAGTIRVTACLGVASLENCSGNIDALLECADQALYAAKQGGRNQVRLYRAAQSDHSIQ